MWKYFKSSPVQGDNNNQPDPETEKIAAPNKKRFKRWHFILLGIGCLLIAGLLSWRSLNGYIQNLASQTPIASAPMQEGLEFEENGNKTEQYKQELMKGKSEERAAKNKQSRWDRMRMAWNLIYSPGEKEPAKEVLPSAPIEAPRARIKRVYRAATYKSRQKPPMPIPKSKKQVSFNLKKGQSGKNLSKMDSQIGRERSSRSAQFVRAVIFGNQSVLPGESVKLQLTQPIQLKEHVIPAHKVLIGTCGFSGGRVQIQVQELIVDGKIIPVSLTAYDQDKAEGLAYADPKLRRRLKQQSARGIEQLLPSVPPTGIGVVDQLVHTGSSLGKTIVRNTGQGNRNIELPDNYSILLNIETK